jgi:carbon-monoxide dehydrogenase medium subunit
MKPAPLTYHTSGSVAEALALFHATDGVAKYIAGGQTLAPMINLRLSQPDSLIDLSRAPELRIVRETSGAVLVGAGIRHAEIEDGQIPDPSCGLMQRAARTLAYRAVRNRGTIGGSLAHADPIAEWPVVMTALRARLHLTGRTGQRDLAMEEFLLGYLTTGMAEEEILTAIAIPRLPTGSRIGLQKFCRKAGEFAQSLAVCVLTGREADSSVVLGSAMARPRRLEAVTALLCRETLWRDGMAAELRSAFIADTASAGLIFDDYEAHLHATMVTRAAREALGG